MKAIIKDVEGKVVKTIDGTLETVELNTCEGETYEIVDSLPDILSNMPTIDAGNMTKERLVSRIKVTTSTGKVFDGDEKSQERILRAINIATITGDTTTQWKMADNTIIEVTLEELKEALALAGKEMSRIWLE